MENVTELFTFITTNWDGILISLSAIAGGVISIASVIVKFTKSETDNVKLAKVVKFFEKFSMNSEPIKLVEKK